MEVTVTIDRDDQPTMNEIRKTFRGMVRRLQFSAQRVPDWQVRDAKIMHLEILLAHSINISDPDELTDFCLASIAAMKCSIDAARVGPRDPLVDFAFEDIHNDEATVDIRSIIYAALHH